MFSVMTWNLENFERPAANAEQAIKNRYAQAQERGRAALPAWGAGATELS